MSTGAILFVDDELPIRETLALCFRKQGLPVVTACSAAEAKLAAATVAFDLVILDLDLAGENGLDLMGFFKAKYPRLPIIIFTAFGADKDLLAKSLAAGASAFMDKTESLHRLLAEVRRHLPGTPLTHPLPLPKRQPPSKPLSRDLP